MSTLRSQINDLAAGFVDQVMSAIKATSLHELVGASDVGGSVGPRRAARMATTAIAPVTSLKTPARKPGRLPRRSDVEIQASLAKIVALLQKHKQGLRAEEIRSNLAMQAKEMPRILKAGLSARKLSSKGQKRATTYFAK
jgi:hypothetical protein